MKKYKIYFCIIIIFLISIIFPLKNVLAKYIFTESIIAVNIDIDRTKPKVQVIYSEKDIANNKVVVTIKANEEVKPIKGWQLQKDKKTLIKEYNKNIIEEIEIQDLSGNKISQAININQIAPIIEIHDITNSDITYQNYANNEQILQNVIKDDSHNLNIKTEIDNTNIVNN